MSALVRTRPVSASRQGLIGALLSGRYNRLLLAIALTELGLAIRLLGIRDIPAEMWGDVIQHHLLASEVLRGEFFTEYRFGGDGPMFSYIVAGLASILGLSFFTIKLASVLIGAALVPAIYYLADELFPDTAVAPVAGFLAAVSFWSVTFSRQGKPYILVPLFVALTVLFGLKGRWVVAGIMLGLGIYTQAAFWGMPFAAFVASPMIVVVGVVVAAPEIHDFLHSPGNYFGSGSYLGDKMGPLSPGELVGRVLENAWRNILSFNVRGDITFRHNIVNHPHLDWVSGVLFWIGLAVIVVQVVRTRDLRLTRWFLVPLVLVQVPSIMDVHPENVPSMGRMLGIVPFVFIATAVGLLWVGERVRRLPVPALRTPFLSLTLAAILVLNMVNYFVIYPRGLPNGNTPYGRIIAGELDRYPVSTQFVLLGCCWGQWGQPEPEAIQYVVTGGRQVLHLSVPVTYANQLRQIAWQLLPGQYLVVVSAPEQPFTDPLGGHAEQLHTGFLRRNGWTVAWIGVWRGR